MSDEELKNNINLIAHKIMEVEEIAKKKESYIQGKLNEKFDFKMSELDIKLQKERHVLEDLNKKIEFLMRKKKESTSLIKQLETEFNALKKEKEKTLSSQLKAISNEKKTLLKPINREIKSLEKDLKKTAE